MYDYAILFAYYGAAPVPVVERNLSRLRAFHPGVPIVPLLHDGEPWLLGTFDARQVPGELSTACKWQSCDAMLYQWYRHRPFRARRYIYLEWDTYCSTSVADFYEPVWQADAAAVDVFTHAAAPSWHWFYQVPLLGALRPCAAGVTPFAGTMLSDDALAAICGMVKPDGVFCELRLGTLLTAVGANVAPMPFARGRISWLPRLIRVDASPAIFHPVKTL